MTVQAMIGRLKRHAGHPRAAIRLAWFRLYHERRPPHTIRCKIGKNVLRLRSNSVLASRLYSGRGFEENEWRFLQRIVRPGMTVLDIGANVGFYAVQLARLAGSTGRIYCFEPYAPIAEYLEHNIAENDLANVTVVRKAVSDTAHTASLNVFPDGKDVFNSLGVTRPPVANTAVTTTVPVETTTVDRFCAEHGLHRIDVMKIDVEGAEEKVIEGAARTLSGNPDMTILMETYEPMARQCQCSSPRVIRSLLARGFAAYAIGERGSLVPIHTTEIQSLDEREIVNIVFRRGGSSLKNDRV